MKAIQISAPGELGVVDINTPVPGEDEVLLKIKYVGFCGSDLNTFLGKNPMVRLPIIPGHEVGAGDRSGRQKCPGRFGAGYECDGKSLYQLR